MRVILLAGEKAQHSNGSTLRLRSLERYFGGLGHTVDIEHFVPRGSKFPLQYRYLLRGEHRRNLKNLVSNYDLVVVTNPSLSVVHSVIASKANMLDVCDSMISMLKFRSRNESITNFLKSCLSALYLTLYIRKHNAVTYITLEDSLQDGLINKRAKIAIIPNSCNTLLANVPPTKAQNKQLVVGFIADLEYSLNEIQYNFILRELLPSILEFGFVLHLFGKKPQNFQVPNGVHHWGFIPSILDVYKRIDISLCPDFHGFGFKNKVQESLLASRPVVTTPLGARGQARVEGLIVNTTASEMIISLRKLSDRNLLRTLSQQMKKANSNRLETHEDSSWLDDIFLQRLER